MTLLAAIRQILGFSGAADAPPSNNIEAQAAYDPDGNRAVPLAIAARGLIGADGSPGGAVTTATTTNTAETQQVLTDGATVNWDMNLGGYGILTLGGNRTIANPTHTRNGAVYLLEVIQDGTGGRTATWGDNFIWSGGTAPTPTATAAKRDIFTFVCSGGKLYGTITGNF